MATEQFQGDRGSQLKGQAAIASYFNNGSMLDAHDQEAEDVLEHHGIKGMRWGIRRPRGPDGLVDSSSAGEKTSQVLKGAGRGSIKAVKATGRATASGARKAKEFRDSRNEKKRQKAIKAGNHKALRLKDLSDEELRNLVNRMNLEQQYTRLTTPENTKTKSAGSELVASIVKSQIKTHANAVLTAKLEPGRKKIFGA